MPSKDKDSDIFERPREERHRSERGDKSERRKRDKDKDKDKERGKDRERDREREREGNGEDPSSSTHKRHHKSSKSSRSKPTESETHSRSHRKHRTTDSEIRSDLGSRTAMSELVPELSRGASTDRVNIPYPSFSKAHSKELLHSKEDLSAPAGGRRTDPLTPEPTDLGSNDVKRSKSAELPRKASSAHEEPPAKERPPSPPETDLASQKSKRRSGTPLSARDEDRAEERPRSRTSWVSGSTSKNESKSKLSKASSQATFVKSPTVVPPGFGSAGAGDGRSSIPSTGPRRSNSQRTPSSQTARPPSLETDSSPESVLDSSPKTPTQTPQFPPPSMDDKPQIRREDADGEATPAAAHTSASMSFGGPPPPPPPPPPPLNIQEAPRVDYLMQYGGLPAPVPKNLLAVLPRQNGTRPSNPPLQGAETLFAPFFNLLNQYQTVLSGNGSIAVATGHQTIARRLLDRLENVFSRDLSPNGCPCVVCEHSDRLPRGLGWGEVLERVSGRIDLPPWPPFDLSTLGSKAAEDAAGAPVRPESPVSMDPDIGEEFREHYLRQTRRVRAVVDKWMTNCDKVVAPLPAEVDDETLSFAVLTSLDPEDRPYFNSLISGSRELQPATRAPTPSRKPRNDFVVKTGLSLQRLYRLSHAPRDAETAVYLVKNPSVHDLIYTISDINPSEWEILISGRFDGFLWSGADDDFLGHGDGVSRGATPASGIFPMRSPSVGRAMGSRTNTPFSRGATPASFISSTSSYPARSAVSHDEEAEIAVLAEIERELFSGMEALEDAFEKLHSRAEVVREALRQRGAGLSVSLQRRRLHGIDVLPLSGSSGANDRPAWGNDEDSVVSEGDWVADDMSELMPEDSASQISSSRHRRPRRRKERNTPAPIEEE